MQLLKNSSGQILMTGGHPIKQTDSTPDASTITLYSSHSSPEGFLYIDCVNHTLGWQDDDYPGSGQYTVSGHVGDIVISYGSSSSTTYTGATEISFTFGEDGVPSSFVQAYRITSTTATFSK